MIAKKKPKADLEKKRFAFFQIGLIVAGSLCLAAFEFSSVQSVPVATIGSDADYTTDFLEPDLQPLPEPETQEKKKRVLDLSTVVIVTPEPVVDPVPEPDPTPTPDPGPIVFDPDPSGGTTEPGTYIPPTVIWDVPAVDPKFPGGTAAMSSFINKYINIPQFVMDTKGGTVFIEFVVNKDGSIEQTKVVGHVSPELDKAALDVIARMPNWTPAEQAGKTVRSRLTIPINILLR
ncbi:MAG: TonB family protein [Crocinitomix sp.]|nr:TonB family protein [Crocinitomix sp.]